MTDETDRQRRDKAMPPLLEPTGKKATPPLLGKTDGEAMPPSLQLTGTETTPFYRTDRNKDHTSSTVTDRHRDHTYFTGTGQLRNHTFFLILSGTEATPSFQGLTKVTPFTLTDRQPGRSSTFTLTNGYKIHTFSTETSLFSNPRIYISFTVTENHRGHASSHLDI